MRLTGTRVAHGECAVWHRRDRTLFANCQNGTQTLYRAKAPLRISFAGGGTDVPPYPELHGGAVLSATIDKYAYATLLPRADRELYIQSLDYDTVARFDLRERLDYDGNLDLIKAAVNRVPGAREEGIGLFIHSDAPPGTGLGSSSALVVAVVGVMMAWLHLPLTDYEVADLAYQIERVELAIKGGLQDQYAATFGGFNFIEFYRDATIVNPLRIRADVLNELQYCLLMCYTGQARLSAGILDTQIRNYRAGREETMAALARLKAITLDAKAALLQGRLDDFGALLHEAWEEKKKLAPQISNSRIDEMYTEARRQGALGGKILGAGGGGHLLIYCPFARKHLIAAALVRAGGRVVEFAFERRGLQTWRVGR